MTAPQGAPPDDAQRWILALTAILTEMNEGDHRLMGGVPRPSESGAAIAILHDAWGVDTGAEAIETMRELLESGHRARFALAGHRPAEQFLAWDCGRIVAVAGWAYAAYLIDAETAWSWMRQAAERVRPAFGSWAEYAASYVAGRVLWKAGVGAPEDEDDDDDAAGAGAERGTAGYAGAAADDDDEDDDEDVDDDEDGDDDDVDDDDDGDDDDEDDDDEIVDEDDDDEPEDEDDEELDDGEDGEDDEDDEDEAELDDDEDDDAAAAASEEEAEEDDAAQVESIVAQLLNEPGSAWVMLPWTLALPADIPPPVPARPRFVVDHAGGGDGRTIGEVLARAGEDALITVRAGTYHESLSPEDAAELTADGEVVIEAADTYAFEAWHGGFVLRGFTLRAPVRGDDEARDACRAGNFLRLERCDISAARFGVDLLDDDALVQISGCTIHDCGSVGIIVEDGNLLVVDTAVAACKHSNLQLGGEGPRVLERVRITDSPQVGLECHDDAGVIIVACEIAGNGSSGIGVQGSARVHLRDTKIHDNRGAGVFVAETAQAAVINCELRDNGLSHIEVAAATEVLVIGSKLIGGGGNGVYFRDGAAGLVEDCELRGTGAAAVLAASGSSPTVRDCRLIAPAAGGGIFIDGGGGAYLRLTIRDTPLVAIEIAGGEPVEIAGVEITGAPVGVFMHGEARARLQEVKLAGITGVGLDISGSSVRLERCSITGAGGVGLQVYDGGKAGLIECEIRDGVDDGIFTWDRGVIALGGCTLGGNQLNLRLTGAEAYLERCQIHDARGAGVFCDEDVKARLIDCEVWGNLDAGVEVAGRAQAFVSHSRIRGRGDHALWVYDDGELEVDGGAVGGGDGYALAIDGAGRAQLRGVAIRPGARGDVEVGSAATAPRLENCSAWPGDN